MKEQELKFKITGEDGVDIECETISTFDGRDNGKHYILYTDNTLDADGNVKVYASTFDPDIEEQTLFPIETEEEWEMIESVLEQVASEKGQE